MRVFISCPFTGLCETENYVVKKEYQGFFEKLMDGITNRGHEYYLAIKRENWGIDHKGPDECTMSDYEGVKDSDLLIVIPGNPISGGVHIELGWASALRKDIHILLENNFTYSPVVMGLKSLTNTKYYNDCRFPDESILDTIFNILDQENKKIEG